MTAGRDGARAFGRGGSTCWSSGRVGGVAMAALVAVALVAAGCSSSKTDTTSSASGSNRGTAVGGGPGVVSGPGAGWDCPGGTCTWSNDAPADAVAGTPNPVVPTTAAPSTSTARTPGAERDPSMRLDTEAASIDDNAAFPAYLRYRKAAEALGIHVLPLAVEQRRVITVHDPTGAPVLGANVAVTDPAGAVVGLMKTYANGQALFVPPPGSATGVAYAVSATKAGVTASVPLPAGSDEVTVTLAAPPAPVDLDVLFVLDGTGSMDEEIRQLQQGIGPLAAQLERLAAGGTVQFGLTVYRDRNDLFVTRTFNFTPDAAAFGRALAEVQVGGGGDTPEDVETGLHDALSKPSWRFGETVKLLFLVGDAPPHLDYPDSVPYPESITNAVQQGVKIMTIGASGLGDQGEYVFRQLAQATMGRFVFLTSGSTGARAVQGRSHQITADAYSDLPLDQLVLRLTQDEVASHG